jgi:hypothetical protein
MDRSPKERKIVQSQYKASRLHLQSVSAKVTPEGGLFGLALVAYATYKVNDTLTRNYLVFLLLMFGLVNVARSSVSATKTIFERFMNAAFDKLDLNPQRASPAATLDPPDSPYACVWAAFLAKALS